MKKSEVKDLKISYIPTSRKLRDSSLYLNLYIPGVRVSRVFSIFTLLLKYFKINSLMALFEAKNVTKQYGNQLALDNVSISVPEQCIYGLLGPNGAGKTTLIRIINQITGPDTGELIP
jgi:ABC-type polysaccharide/polyol phosphate transport system ATPase subunit